MIYSAVIGHLSLRKPLQHNIRPFSEELNVVFANTSVEIKHAWSNHYQMSQLIQITYLCIHSQGILDKCTVEHGKKDWKRRHFVFKHILASNIRSLEFYPAATKNWRKSEPKGVLALYPGYEVLKVHEPRRNFVFEIKTFDHTYRLAAHSEDELNQWILILERESISKYFLACWYSCNVKYW